MSKSRPVTIMIQTPLQSWLCDLGSMGIALALVGLGVYRVRSINAARDTLDAIELMDVIQ